MSIRNILMSLSTGLAVLALSLSPAGPARAASADGARMDLPAPDKKGGMPLMQALAERHSSKSGYTGAPLSAQELSNLLWATWGVNRPDGRRTAPSAMNRQEVAVYVVRENGVWRYDAAGHALIRELSGDYRDAAGGGSLVRHARGFALPERRALLRLRRAGQLCARFRRFGPGRQTAPARRLARAHRPDRGSDSVTGPRGTGRRGQTKAVALSGNGLFVMTDAWK